MRPEYYTWEDRGKTYTQITARTKQAILAGYALRYSLRTFVETGSCNGDCLLALHGLFEHSYSVELLESQFRFTQDKLHSYSDISLFNGDSADVLPQIIHVLKGRPTLFWLDAHGDNWIGPVVQELEAIFASEVKGAILIDDMDYITDTLPENEDWEKTSDEYGIVRLVHRTL